MLQHRLRARNEALANQWLPASQLQQIQFTKLRHLIAHSYENVPFQRKRFIENGLGSQLRSVTDLKKIPMMNKDSLRRTPINELVAQDVGVRSLWKQYTSGTTGTPVQVLLDKTETLSRQASSARTSEALGYDPWDHGAVLHFTYPKKRAEKSLEMRLREWLFRRRMRYSRPFYFTYDCEEVLEDLLKFKPKVIDGQPSYLKNLAQALQRSGRMLAPNFLASNGDILDSATRTSLEGFFGCPV